MICLEKKIIWRVCINVELANRNKPTFLRANLYIVPTKPSSVDRYKMLFLPVRRPKLLLLIHGKILMLFPRNTISLSKELD